jgi:hypothetical protein
VTLDATIGGVTADTYATLAEYTTRAAAFGWTLANTAALNEINLRRAAVAIDVGYSFKGRKRSRDQAREWPRIDTGYIDGWPVASDTIPGDVKGAQMEMAYLIQNGADPLATVEAVIASTRAKAGPVEVETQYQGGLSLPRYTSVLRLLRPYLGAGSGMAEVVRG